MVQPPSSRDQQSQPLTGRAAGGEGRVSKSSGKPPQFLASAYLSCPNTRPFTVPAASVQLPPGSALGSPGVRLLVPQSSRELPAFAAVGTVLAVGCRSPPWLTHHNK